MRFKTVRINILSFLVSTVTFLCPGNDNLIYDLDRDIVTIRYNLLNLPDTVQFRDGRQILNKYTADGTRLASTYYTPTHITVQPLSIGEVADYHSYPQYLLDRVRTWFVGNKEYGLMYPEHYDYLELKRIHTPEGYVDYKGNYYYYRRDHLGNVREVWKATDSVALTVQRTRYYPSGLPWEYQEGDSASLQPYKYGSKEFVETHGLDMYDSHARWYYATIMRTITPDPMAEVYYGISPYAWCANNPIRNVDRNGEWVESAWDAFSLVTGVNSFVTNVRSGNVGGAIVDGFGVVLDVAALVVPAIPGGVGAGIKAVRAGDDVVDAMRSVDNGIDAANTMDNAVDAIKSGSEIADPTFKGARFVSDTDKKLIDLQATPKGSYTHPDGSRTDVLQTKSHFDKRSQSDVGTTHTHEKYSNIRPDGTVEEGASRNNAHPPTYEEVQRILDKTAIKTH